MKIILLTTFLLFSFLFSIGQADDISKSSRTNIPDQIKNRKAFKRAEWFNTQRAFPYDTIPRIMYVQEMDREIKKTKSNKSTIPGSLSWSSPGPVGVQSGIPEWGIVSGRVRAIAIHPNDPLTVYIGAANGGIWKTIDGGQTWEDIGHDLESLSFGAITIDPNNPETIYAGTGECAYLQGFIGFDGKGIFKSTDGGNTWNQITNGIGVITSFADLAVSPHNSNLVIGAMASGYFYSGNLPNEGIWRSMDAGETWTRTLDVQDAYDIAFHPSDANKVYAAIGGGNSNAGFYTSNNQGISWLKNNFGLPPANSMHRIQIDISKSNPNIIYAVIFNLNTMSTSAYKTVNGGISWAQISSGTNLGGFDGSAWYDQGFYDLCIAVDPVNPNHVLIGNIELHRTTNGATFTPVRPYGGNNLWGSLVHCDYHKLVFAPSNPDYLYVGCDGGLYQSTDKGYTASACNQGLETLQFYRIASHPTDPQVLLGGMQDNSTAMTTNGGSTWEEVTGGDGMECLFSPDPDTVYSSAQCGYLFRSINGGASFGYLANINGAWITPLLMHPVNHKTLYAANKSIVRSTNGGNSWQVIAANVAPEFINTMAQSQVNPNYMIFATGCTQNPVPGDIIIVKISTNGGYNWTDVTANIPGESRWISRVNTDPVDDSTMYVLRTGFSPGNKVWKTIDLGQTWTNISGDLPDLPCSDLFVDPENTHHLYVANDVGVYRSTDCGTHWEYASEGVPFVPVIDFDYAKINSTRYLRIGTFGRSIYETTLPHYCLPEGITFTTQAEIDNFQINYPGCTEIEGDVHLEGSWPNGNDIINLNGLSNLTSIGGDLTIYGCDTLVTLTGLENLTTVGGDLIIEGNYAMTNFIGLDNLNSIGGDFQIGLCFGCGGSPEGFYGNPVLTSVTGIENIASIGGDLQIGLNHALASLTGLQNLTSIAGTLYIFLNDSLTGLSGLENLSSIGGGIIIYHNNALVSLSGIDNIDAASIVNLQIAENASLSYCEAQSICTFLASPNGAVDIYSNAPGCNNPPEIASGCGITLDCLPFGNYYFSSQVEIDSFHFSYPGCNVLEGNVTIGGSDIIELNGLNGITSIGGNCQIGTLYLGTSLTTLEGLDSLNSTGGSLLIQNNSLLSNLSGLDDLDFVSGNLFLQNNSSLTELTGLDHLNSIGGTLSIYSNHIENLEGLVSLKTIGGSFYISGGGGNDYHLISLAGLDSLSSIGGSLNISFTNNLTSISGLSNLRSVGGSLYFFGNQNLTSLTGLDSIDAGSVTIIHISHNNSLSTCAVKSICDYLADPNGEIHIGNNAPGCNSPEEVQAACDLVIVENIFSADQYSLFPNPADKSVTISSNNGLTIESVMIYSQTGQKVLEGKPVSQILDISKLQPGMYIVELCSGQRKARKKLVVE